MATNKEIDATEHEHQVAVFEWAGWMKHKHPELGLLFAIPNGGMRHVVVAMKLKAEGVKSGIPDICLPVARNGYHSLYIEMKRKKGGQARQGQREWLNALNKEGFMAVICKGSEAAIEVIENYLGIK